MHKERIFYLLNLYYENSLSHDESIELSLLINETDQEEVINALSKIISAAPDPESENADFDEAEIKYRVSQILAIDSHLEIKAATAKSKFKLSKYGVAAAAAVLIILLGTYIISRNSFIGSANSNNIAKTIDVQPGNKGAVLVLSDGTEVLLDSVSNGKVIVGRDGSKIRIDNGQIVYLDKNAKASNINTVRTPKGRQYHLTLSDGTKVWLNAASSIEYPVAFTTGARKVTISGEAYFEVVKNPKKPFRVNIADSKTNIEVLGTHFNVNTYADNGNYKTTLLEGSIKLNTGKLKFLLKPNQQAITQPQSDQFQIIENINPEDIVAWKNDLFYFNEASIDDVMQELARWYSIDVSYQGSKPSGTFTGKIDKNLTLRQALKILGATRVKYELLQNNKLIIQ
ncbi:FecR family protein [Pedobacter endophyticus]|uniref:FecR domain-containing protein n=1 Tax=Pedobacter endophyticus TaxID=2789740 RepID=A0A7S9L2A4_9SPHI|nr:FecR family protein [Pedobacter endophyticus]QPH41199.1 FecR domain-containing protein [Pedobacter endophyticus]